MAEKGSLLKILGIGAAAIGFISTLVSDWVNEQEMDKKIEEKVSAALAERNEEES